MSSVLKPEDNKDPDDILSADSTWLNLVDFDETIASVSQKNTSRKANKKFAVLSLNKTANTSPNVGSSFEFDTVGSYSHKRSSNNRNDENCDLHTKRQKVDEISLFQDTFDNIDDTRILMSNSNDVTKEDKTERYIDVKHQETDAFQSYFNINVEEKENASKMSQLTQFFKNSQVLNQIDSVISQECKTFKVPRPVESDKNKTEKSKQIETVEKLGDVFHESTREEFEQFFDRVEHSISMMGADEYNKNETFSQILEVLFTQHTDENKIPSSETLANISWDDKSVLNASGMNLSFATALKQAFLANASKDVTLAQSLNSTNVERNKVMFKNMGPFYGLPYKVKELIKSYRGIEELYDWQDECLNLPAIENRNNLIYALPTSGGKTLVAEILMLREIICYKRNALFILPFVAIVQEKVWGLSPFAVALDFLVEEYAASKGTYPPRKRRRKNSIYIATIEKALGLLNSLIETERIHEIGLIVVDELHLVGEQNRGNTLEALLTKIMLTKADTQIIGMSATIGNVNDLCKFLNAEIYMQNFRPVELVEYVKCGDEIATINWSKKEEELLTVVRKPDFGYSDVLNTIDPDKLGGLVMEVVPKDSCLIFCASKKNCENVAYLLCRVANKKLLEYNKEEKRQVKHALKDEGGSLCKIFNVSIPYGIAYHHSGLTNEERRVIEDSFRAGIISVICCTSTLAAGVNLPAKRVILRQPYVGRDFISLSRYKQMTGRAGRAGLGETGDSILICTPQDLPKVKKLLMSPMDKALSSMHEAGGKGLRHLLLSCISLGIANTRSELQEVSRKTLLQIQSVELDVNVKKVTDNAITDLFKLGALQEADLSKPETSLGADVTVRMDTSTANLSWIGTPDITQQPVNKKRKIVIKNDTKLVISRLGCAAIKGNFELTVAHMLYDDLHEAQKSVVLLDCLHLLYLVTPYELAQQVKPNQHDYYTIYIKLSPNELQTAKILGIDDAVAHKMLSNQQIKNVPERVLNRFYLTLMLYDLWNEKPVFEVAEKFQVTRGIVQNLMTSASTFASNVVNFCEGIDEFWTFAHLLKGMSQRLSHCCVRELLSLMELPAVKQSRAKQLYNAGYKTLQSIAKASPEGLVENIEFMSRRVANQLIAAAKMLLLEKVENLREEAEDVLDGVQIPHTSANQSR